MRIQAVPRQVFSSLYLNPSAPTLATATLLIADTFLQKPFGVLMQFAAASAHLLLSLNVGWHDLGALALPGRCKVALMVLRLACGGVIGYRVVPRMRHGMCE
jgi:hypothetical protein